ncbi:hypothetical protein BsIDN1_13240 [Bacillus safensis]|uniref:Uncharacterized protein n=1 Tax=Bacillus safensis TaxID=561879 RepID=A0A5S9M832_BACIA|nr:hypothetical protein BsIDN1_13240 [Bacillus safensis]
MFSGERFSVLLRREMSIQKKCVDDKEDQDPAADIDPYIGDLNDVRLIKSSLYPHGDQCCKEHF